MLGSKVPMNVKGKVSKKQLLWVSILLVALTMFILSIVYKLSFKDILNDSLYISERQEIVSSPKGYTLYSGISSVISESISK